MSRENRAASERPFQYRLWDLVLIVACAALVLGAAQGGPARMLLIGASLVVIFVVVAFLTGLGVVLVAEATVTTREWACWSVRLPFRVRQVLFERRLARLRPGNSSQQVRGLLGRPRRIDGFGDRQYWSYRVAGRRYTVAFDPRKLVAKYSNGLARDLPKHRVRSTSLRLCR